MICPKCSYLMQAHEVECPRCAKLAATPSAAVAPVQTSAPSMNPVSAGTTGIMGIIGIILLAFGVLGACFFFFIFNTTVQVPTFEILGTTAGGGYVNNLGLMADRQNGILFSFGIMILGCFLMFMDRSNPGTQPVDQKTKTIVIGSATGLGVLALIFMGILSIRGNNVQNSLNNSALAAAASSPTTELIRKADSSNLKVLSLAIYEYTDNNGDVMPDMTNADSFKTAITPVLNEATHNGENIDDIFLQEGTKEPYQPNSALSKINETKITDPQSIVELYQKTPYSDMTRNVAFCDGHVKLIDENTWTTLKQQSGISN